MNLFYEDYPTVLKVKNEFIPIITDFREYIKLLDMLNDEEVNGYEKMLFLQQYFLKEPKNMDEAISRLTDFVSMQELNDMHTEESGEGEDTDVEEPKPLFSFALDYPYILAGFWQDYGIDISEIKYLHWWKFRQLFDGLSEKTEIKQRIMYRSIDLSTIKDKDERKRIEKIQRSIKLPESELTEYDIGNAFM